MLLSICVPTYNGEKYLSRCIESILNQTFGDFEIIICDDCSTDNTVEIIKSYQRKDSRIKFYINEKNLGLVGNWNHCIELATGEWIKFVFQDDIILSECIKSFMAVIEDNIRMIICERDFIFEENVSAQIIKQYKEIPMLFYYIKGNVPQYVSPRLLSRLSIKLLPNNFIGEPTSVMFQKSCVKQLGEFEDQITQISDIEYLVRVGTNYGFIYIPSRLVKFRVHNDSHTQKNNSGKFFSMVFVDRIIVMHKMLYSAAYSNFRHSVSFYQLLKFKNLFFQLIYRAKYFIKQNDNDGKMQAIFLNLQGNFREVEVSLPRYVILRCSDAIIWSKNKFLSFANGKNHKPQLLQKKNNL